MGEEHLPLSALHPRAIVFDLDGTLVDSYDAIHESLNAARAAKGMAPLPYETVRRMVGRGLECLVADAMGPDLVEEGVRLFRARYREICLDRTTLLPEVSETLADLHRAGLPMAICSNKPGYFSTQIMEHLGVRRCFTVILGPEHTERPKPDPEMLHRALDAMRASPGESLYVGDMPMDVTVARAAGVRVALLATGSSTADEVGRAGADWVLQRFSALKALAPGPR